MADNAWKPMTLGEFTTLQRGHDLPEERRRTGQIPILGSFGITGWHDEARAAGPGVTVGRSGASFGVVSYSSIPYWPLNTALYVKDFHGNDERFAYYLLKTFDFKRYNSGSAQPSLNRNYIHPIRIDVPPLSEQNAIAHILGTLDDKIELNRRMNETLESMARAIFKSWFVDFDPVRAKMDGRKPAGMDAATAALFPDSFEDSELGKGPKGWRAGALNEVAKLQAQSVLPNENPTRMWEHYSIPAFDEGKRPVWELGREIKSNKYAVPQHSVLVSKLNPQFPRVWVPDLQDAEGAVCSTEFMPFVPLKSSWRSFLYETVRADTIQSEILARATGSTGSRQRVKPKEVAAILIIIPQEHVIDGFCKRVAPIHEKQLLNICESQRLATIRDTLLPKLLSGEIQVDEARKTVAEVA